MAWPVAARGHGLAAPPAPGAMPPLISFTNTEAETLVLAMTTRPPEVRQGLIDDFVGTMKTDGVWAKMDGLWVMAAHNEQASRLNWKSPSTFEAVATNSPVFTADVGWKSDNTSSFLNTGLSLLNDTVNYTQNDASMGFRWAGTSSDINTYFLGQDGSPLTIYRLRPSTNAQMTMNYNGMHQWSTAGDYDVGLWVATRTGSANSTFLHYVNGVNKGSADVSIGTSQTPTDFPFSILKGFVSYTPDTASISFAFLGASLTPTEVTNLDAALDTYLAGL